MDACIVCGRPGSFGFSEPGPFADRAWKGTGRRVTLAEPAWDAGIAVVTFNATWTGSIDRLQLELTSGADGSNYVEIDWIAVGRPAPGASSAELVTEQQARIAGDSALASDLTALSARVTDAETGLAGTATALDAVETRVDATEAGIVAAASRLDTVEADIADPATGLAALASAIDLVEAEAVQTAEGQTVQAGALRALESAIRGVAAEGIEGAAQAHQAAQAVRDYVATAAQDLNTRVDLTDAQVAIVAQAVTALQAAIPGLATADAVQALSTLVTAQGSQLVVQADAITALTAIINDPAIGLGSKLAASLIVNYATIAYADGVAQTAASAATTALQSTLEGPGGSVSAAQAAAQAAADLAGSKGKVLVQATTPAVGDRLPQNLWIDTTGGANTPKRWNGSAWVAVTDKVATDAAAAGAAALAGLTTKADAAALNALTTRVEATETGILAEAQRTDLLRAAVGQPGNIILNGAFATGDLNGWASVPAAWTVVPRNPAAPSGPTRDAPAPFMLALASPSPSNQTADCATGVLARAGDQFWVSWAQAVAGASRSLIARLRFRFFDPNGAMIADVLATSPETVSTGWGTFRPTAPVVAPAGAASVDIALVRVGGGSGTGYVTDIRVEQVSMAEGASGEAVQALTVRVTEVEGDQSVVADALTRLGAVSPSGAAQTLLQMTAQSGPSGTLARIGLRALAGDTSDNTRAAALFLDALADGGSRIIAEADRFHLLVGGSTTPAFTVQAGQIRLNSALIRLDGNVTVDGSFTVNGNVIVNGSITGPKIAEGAVTTVWRADGDGPFAAFEASSGGQVVCSLDIGAVTRGSIIHRGLSFEAQVPTSRVGGNVTLIELQRRSRQLGGAWTAWSTIETFSVIAQDWDVYSDSGSLTGSYDAFEYRVRYRTDFTSAQNVLRNVTIVARNVVK